MSNLKVLTPQMVEYNPSDAVLKAGQEDLLKWALIDFKEAIRVHGVDTVIKAMDEETFLNLFKWFNDTWDGDVT